MRISKPSENQCRCCKHYDICKKDSIVLPPKTIVKYPCGYTVIVPDPNVNKPLGYITNK